MGRPTPSASMPLERSLEEVIDRLSGAEQSPDVRGLLIEARRLRSIIANWRSIPPLPQVREEMVARVIQISAAVGDSLPLSTLARGATMRIAQPVPAMMHAEAFVPMDGPVPSERLAGQVTSHHPSITPLPETPLDVRPVRLPEDLDPRLVMLKDPYSVRADAYRALRHRLSSSGDPRIIAVSSAGPGEGKTTCSINLAVALREGARGRVLLVEGNLRSPAIAGLLGFSPPECFGVQLLRHRKNPLSPWVAVEPLSPLHVMAVNPYGEHPPLLDPVAFSIAIDRLRLAGYDYIVVDTPPVLESADVNMIADSVDGVLFTTWVKKSEGKALRQAIQQLGTINVLGTVLIEG